MDSNLETVECPICGRKTACRAKRDPELQIEEWGCRCCGEFTLHRTGLPEWQLKQNQAVLAGLVRERSIRSMPALVIRDDNLDSLLSLGPTDPPDAFDRFLLNLAVYSSEPGIFTYLTSHHDGSLAFAEATDSFIARLDFLQSQGLIQYQGKRQDSSNDLSYRLTAEGWNRVRELKDTTVSSKAFVAMPFGAESDRIWGEAIEPAIIQSGWTPIRADKVDHNEQIDDWVMNQIREASIVVVDTTGSNAGACFEAGYALGLGKPVVWLCRRDSMKDGLHFDIRQYNHLRWTEGNEPDLLEPLVNRIVNTIGSGPIVPRSPSKMALAAAGELFD